MKVRAVWNLTSERRFPKGNRSKLHFLSRETGSGPSVIDFLLPEAASVESEQFEYYHNDDNDADDVKDVITHNQCSSRNPEREMSKTLRCTRPISFNPAEGIA